MGVRRFDRRLFVGWDQWPFAASETTFQVIFVDVRHASTLSSFSRSGSTLFLFTPIYPLER